MSAAFDAAGYVADLRAIGLTVSLGRERLRGEAAAGAPFYFVRAPASQGLGSQSGYDDVMARWRDAMVEHPGHRQAVADFLAGERPAAFDPAAFVADLRAAGCRVVLSEPGTRFGPGEEVATYFIGPADGRGFGDAYSDVMLKWADALAATPDDVEQVVAHLSAAWDAGT